MDQQSEAPKARLALQPGHQIVGEGDLLECLAEHELARVEDERLVLPHRHQLGEVLHGLAHVYVGIAGVVEHPEAPVHADVHAGWLDQTLVERLDLYAPGLYLSTNGAVAEYHGRECSPALGGQVPACRADTPLEHGKSGREHPFREACGASQWQDDRGRLLPPHRWRRDPGYAASARGAAPGPACLPRLRLRSRLSG